MEMHSVDDYNLCSQEEDNTENFPRCALCCTYTDQQNEPNHIVASCCDCEELDKILTDWIEGHPVDSIRLRSMLLTFQDRLRISWRGGAKQVTSGNILPLFVIPVLISLAAINAYTCIIIFVASTVMMCYAFNYAQRRGLRTHFFFMWIFWSLVYLILLFEFTVPLLELLPEENLALVALSIVSLMCFCQTRRRAHLNHVVKSTLADDGLPDITEASVAEEEEATQTTLLLEHDIGDVQPAVGVNINQPNICSSCRKCVPPRTAHCSVCGACIKRHDHHSYWLSCCIGESNRRLYVIGLGFAILALSLGADLTLTAVCHPFLAANILGLQILLPDDCSEVFDIYELGIAFVIASYALLITAYAFVIFVRQIYFISRGITLHECKRGQRGNNTSLKQNWKNFVT